MGVIACSKKGCTNIMCDRGNFQYNICNECFEDLVRTGPATDIDHFMDTPVKRYNEDAARARYEVEFPLR